MTRALPPVGGYYGTSRSGVALSPRVVLTVASCLQGANDFYLPGGPETTVVHTFDYPLGAAPSFNAPNPALHDIAVLILPTDYQPLSFLGTPGSFPDIAPALPTGGGTRDRAGIVVLSGASADSDCHDRNAVSHYRYATREQAYGKSDAGHCRKSSPCVDGEESVTLPPRRAVEPIARARGARPSACLSRN